jgi:hypothetical protein
MIKDLSTPVTTTITGADHPLCKAERIASVIVVRVVLLCALAGCRIRHTGSRDEPEELSGSPAVLFPGPGHAIDCGIIPVQAGTAYGFARSITDIQ